MDHVNLQISSWLESIVIKASACQDFDDVSSCNISGSENISLREYPVSRIFGIGTFPISIVAFLTVGNESFTSQRQNPTEHTTDRSTPDHTDNRRTGKQRNNLLINQQLRGTNRNSKCRHTAGTDS